MFPTTLSLIRWKVVLRTVHVGAIVAAAITVLSACGLVTDTGPQEAVTAPGPQPLAPENPLANPPENSLGNNTAEGREVVILPGSPPSQTSTTTTMTTTTTVVPGSLPTSTSSIDPESEFCFALRSVMGQGFTFREATSIGAIDEMVSAFVRMLEASSQPADKNYRELATQLDESVARLHEQINQASSVEEAQVFVDRFLDGQLGAVMELAAQGADACAI